jgi:hypothetical protein
MDSPEAIRVKQQPTVKAEQLSYSSSSILLSLHPPAVSCLMTTSAFAVSSYFSMDEILKICNKEWGGGGGWGVMKYMWGKAGYIVD